MVQVALAMDSAKATLKADTAQQTLALHTVEALRVA